jgi:hypothetical protein
MTRVSKKSPGATHALRQEKPSAPSVEGTADALLRAALEACRPHERVGRLLDKGSADDELRGSAALCELADRQLAERTATYEAVAAGGKGTASDDFWRAANTLWHASREYARRHHSCDSLSTTLSKHSSDKLGELAMEYELEASSLLALRQAIAAYRKVRPKAE